MFDLSMIRGKGKDRVYPIFSLIFEKRGGGYPIFSLRMSGLFYIWFGGAYPYTFLTGVHSHPTEIT